MSRGRPWKCPYCGSSRTTSKGKRVTKQMGIRMIRYCKDCKRKFTPRNQKTDSPADEPDGDRQANI